MDCEEINVFCINHFMTLLKYGSKQLPYFDPFTVELNVAHRVNIDNI